MGERVTVKLYDDIDNTKDASTRVHFEYGGKRYQIDLSDENIVRFDAAMDSWIRHARELGRNGKPVAKRNGKAQSTAREKKERNAAIREWARKKKYDVSDRGIIPAAVIEAYDEAHN